MKVLMLSWEYPPKNIGGLSNHVYYLSKNLGRLGHEVHVITCEEENIPLEEEGAGVFVHRVIPYSLDSSDFTKWVMHLNFAMIEAGIKLINANGKFDIIHGHDWLSAYAAKVLKGSYNIPMVCTIHATEHGRNNGIRTEMQSYISSVEWMMTYEAWKVIACSQYMKEEIHSVFNTPLDKLYIVPNGVSVEAFEGCFNIAEFRRNFARDEEKIIFYVGRHVYEKGIQLLIEAAPDILSACSEVKFVIAGKGAMSEELKQKARAMGLENKILFLGYLEDDEKAKLYKASDVAVFPSLYEPFGIVALEAMAAGCPVAVSDVGGLKEIVEHKVSGMKLIPGSKDSIKDNVIELLDNDLLRKAVSENAYGEVLKKYTWDKIAADTIALYEKVREEAKGTEWEVTEIKVKKKAASRKKKSEDTAIEESAADKETRPKRTRKKAANI
ncbi:glycosyltransferase family 4 protein [Clostridium swellfunianum]|uniref:glycosyltransferase family 4 protein n=1 Tax=Clostridium swellfunianum TaxID=1367462 RepID=UPI002030C25F|nr:glycosyltransferase family 4 protein [Clostridium swellfunianum]MCM0646935.1 glycosyltransferase family 4 protein [Clostridium swellfunianum]